ncbi:hypothetical protein BCIN_11g00070 [Botrytis cinerea B05.10]|uniref:Uncharacterized protein n=1 Tax=Botryotinia fuckeliana (strain B05.10) TaxID=332648 RepID=A0A384JVU8_BOTFB|nr:hypothetical protein BCIN_11g00070 [Botrytis cinerea B05.10]ATZ54652.1 hypothetical protein BCIN_11g00070 [Botrytis cinerea B05.10]
MKERLNEINPPNTPESKMQRGSGGAGGAGYHLGTSPNPSLDSSPRLSKATSVDVDTLIVMGQSLVVNGDISTRILQWIVAPTSGTLWIKDPHGLEQPGQNTLV